jgi:hypothetical protein
MNKKYILEYVAGTKGDMVVRFLNGHEPNISFDRANKTEPQFLGCDNWLKLTWAKDLTLQRFEEVLSVNPYEYVPAHPLWCCCPTTLHGEENLLYSKYMDLLKKYNYEIISLKFEPKHYVTIFIEKVLKLKIYKGENEFSEIKKLNNYKNNDSIKILELGPLEIFGRKYQRCKKFNEMTNDRTLLHYEELFCSDSCPFPEHSHREDEWLMLVEQSWCKYDENDYRKFEVPEGCE